MRRPRGVALVVLTALVPACASVPVERPAGPVAVEPGDRVRVTLAHRFAPAPLVGTVIAVGPDTLAVEREEGGERRLARALVERVEVSVARESDPTRAAGEGILAGAPWLVPLAVVLVLFGDEITDGESAVGLWPIFVVPVAALAIVGAVLGGGPQDVWVAADWPADPASRGRDAPTDSSVAPRWEAP